METITILTESRIHVDTDCLVCADLPFFVLRLLVFRLISFDLSVNTESRVERSTIYINCYSIRLAERINFSLAFQSISMTHLFLQLLTSVNYSKTIAFRRFGGLMYLCAGEKLRCEKCENKTISSVSTQPRTCENICVSSGQSIIYGSKTETFKLFLHFRSGYYFMQMLFVWSDMLSMDDSACNLASVAFVWLQSRYPKFGRAKQQTHVARYTLHRWSG